MCAPMLTQRTPGLVACSNMQCLLVGLIKVLWVLSGLILASVHFVFYPIKGTFILIAVIAAICFPCMLACACKYIVESANVWVDLLATILSVIVGTSTMQQTANCDLPEAGYSVVPCSTVTTLAIASIVLASLSACLQCIAAIYMQYK